MAELITKDDLLNKLRAYCETPDDDNIRIKNQIYHTLLSCPELLYALHRNDLETRLFDEDGNINWDSETHEPLGEWDAYFGESGSIRPFLFIPETQTEVRHYLCYQVDSDENVRYNDSEKLLDVTFTIFVHEGDRTDQLTGLPRHDLIASIIRENFAWIGLEIPTLVPVYNKESVTDNHYVVRTLKYQCTLPNDLVKTNSSGTTFYKNKRW